ncbi:MULTISPECIES: GNAT family N-acetyltransferase [Streptomyces]|uniref:GNAT family N-acetyltransferase n=2 Tax=Streptomyces TaxID=1883 RepID=A0ABU2RBW1_9ACTN|nr:MULTISPECIES: GNAT family N-acetyltransferase [unclassified Streptomyces]MBK3596646.1 GNAT family N-acetyltransferase [Streptomyces sp. MBT51]MDT0426355.1 GNAT family N-acetyltransferase [Streptomyces sp. DSM 41770]HBF83474.1 GNAT family N-acetyltransferase [Streptomyces sp.]
MRIRRATTTEELLAAGDLFDSPPREEWAARFLTAAGHLLLLAYVDDRPAGFVSGIEMLHPDKGTEMCLYELSVAPAYRRRGIGRALTAALASEARERGCYGMWVGVERDNRAAVATYGSTGAQDEGVFAMLGWEFGDGEPERGA